MPTDTNRTAQVVRVSMDYDYRIVQVEPSLVNRNLDLRARQVPVGHVQHPFEVEVASITASFPES